MSKESVFDIGDLSEIIKQASSPGGLRDDRVRQIAWPMLLGFKATPSSTPRPLDDWRLLPRHRDEDQVNLDVNRSFVYYPSNQSDDQLDRRRAELSEVITEVLRRHPMLCYFQGFHDIVQVMLLVLGKDLAVDAVTHLSLLRIRDFMLPSLSASLSHLNLLPAILFASDAKLCKHLSRTQPFFALAATLTLYSHEIQDYGAIARLFDFLLAQEAVVSLYLFAVIILSQKEELFQIPEDEPEMLHFTLSKLPSPLDVEGLIVRAEKLFMAYPPEQLPFKAWATISSYSVLKTTRGSQKYSSIEEGERLFTMQASQLKRDEVRRQMRIALWKYRKPAGGIGAALLVGLISFWIQKGWPASAQWLGLRPVWNFVLHLRG